MGSVKTSLITTSSGNLFLNSLDLHDADPCGQVIFFTTLRHHRVDKAESEPRCKLYDLDLVCKDDEASDTMIQELRNKEFIFLFSQECYI